MESKKAFIITPRDMFEKMKLEFNDFKNDPGSSRHATNFVLTAYHLKEWIWKAYLEQDEALKHKISSQIQDKDSYYSFVKSECPEIKYMRELANNIKHFASLKEDEIQETSSGNKTWEEMTCTWEKCHLPWGYVGLIIITKDNQWISALDTFQKVHDYWANYFNTYLLNCP